MCNVLSCHSLFSHALCPQLKLMLDYSHNTWVRVPDSNYGYDGDVVSTGINTICLIHEKRVWCVWIFLYNHFPHIILARGESSRLQFSQKNRNTTGSFFVN